MGDSDKASRTEGDEFRYEELVVALVFLRCLRKDLPDFYLASEVDDMFDDVVVVWGGNSDKHGLLVEVKHVASKELEEIRKAHLFSPSDDNKSGFNINKYHNFYKFIGKELKGGGIQYSLVLSTNAALHDNALDYFDEREVDTVVGAELLHTGGCIFELDPLEVKNNFDPDFVEHFFMFCGQKGVKEIKDEICKELKQLLGSGPAETNRACKELCECVAKWKNRQCTDPKTLNSGWSDWKDIESKYKSSSACIIS